MAMKLLRFSDAIPLDLWIPYIYFQPEVLRCLELVSVIGAMPTHISSRLAVTPSDLAEPERVISDDNRSLVALHPGASDPRRRWSPANFAAVGDALARTGARVVVTGAPPEQDLVSAVARSVQMPSEQVCGQLSLRLPGLRAKHD